jgi:tRNA pseudouridine55 synthase
VNGLLIVDKPGGMTSHDAVALCRKRLGVKRIGHAGTLDPDATGVLVLGIGRGTRLLQFLAADDKEYLTTAALGVETTTYDASGQALKEADASHVDETALAEALQKLRGPIKQMPPMTSAIKIGGERLYKKARRGEEIEREPRDVVIRELDCESFTPGRRATARLRVVCSKGTYIRSLVHDLGRLLGTGAHVAELRRTRSGSFTIDDAIGIDDVAEERVLPMEKAVASYPARVGNEQEVRAIGHGKPIPPFGVEGAYALIDASGSLIAMMADRGDEARSLCVVAGT